MEKFLYPSHPVRAVLTGPSECGKTCFLSNLILNIIDDFSKIYIYSPSLHQELYQKLIKCFTAFLPLNVIKNVLDQPLEELDSLIVEIVNDEDFESSEKEIETYESIEELKYPQDYDSNTPTVIILDDLNQSEMNDPRVQAMFKRSRHSNISIFIISQDYYELPKRTIRANGNVFHIFKPNNFRDVQNLYQDKASMDMTLPEFKQLSSICWNEKYQPLTIDMTKDKFTGRYRLGLNSIFVPNTTPV